MSLSRHVYAKKSHSVSDMLECGLCDQILCNPKMLACEHIFCKCCLDDILQFDSYGNALINCPEGCRMRTFISNKQTTNDLSVTCRAGCSGPVVGFCATCDMFTCSQCWQNNHRKCQLREPLVPLTPYGSKGTNGRSRVMCRTHNTEGVYSCMEDGAVVCVYCTHRYHKDHMYEHLSNSNTTWSAYWGLVWRCGWVFLDTWTDFFILFFIVFFLECLYFSGDYLDSYQET